MLLSASVGENKIKVWSTDSLKQLGSHELSTGGIETFSVAEDSKVIAYGTDYNFHFSKATQGFEETEAKLSSSKHSDWIVRIAASPCSSEVATGSVDGTICCLRWNSAA